ncbi:MAG TPA: protein kinase [Vicinamibacteria bacterium]|nr:protein kinase [Vicinamibacteria bacterium]
MALSTGTRLGPYQVLALLGAGGMGEVYRARDERLARDVAVKLLPPAFTSDPDRVKRFEQEARLAGALNHPNILTVYDVGVHDGSAYLVTELLEGENLRRRLSGGALPAKRALEYAVQIARGLAEAHEKGVVHRDLKPENLFVTRDGRVKILDFGLAKLTRVDAVDLASAVTDTGPGVVLGTAGYMAPEQVRGQGADHRSDVFSFGAILYEMLAGRRAFHGQSAIETMTAILQTEVPDVSAGDPSLPPAVGTIVRHCLEKDPAQRFQSARDMAFDLENVSTVSTPGAALPTARRRAAMPWAVGAAAILAAAVGGFATGRYTERTPAAPAAVRVQRLTDRLGLEESPAVSPDGKSVAFTAAAGGRRHIFVRLMAGGAPLQITRDDADHEFPRWTPDSSSLLYFSPGGEESSGTVWEISALGGVPRRIASGISGADVSHDGSRIAFFRFTEGQVDLMVAARDGSSEKVIAGLNPHSSRGMGSAQYEYPRWSPDDRLLAYQAGLNFTKTIFTIAAEGGAPRPIVEEGALIQGFSWRPDGEALIYSSSSGTTVLYLPSFNLWEAPLRRGAARQLTFGESSYLTPDVRTAGLLVASRVRSVFDVWKFPVKGTAAEAVANAVNLTRQTGHVQTPSVSPGDRELVYLADSGGHGNLWVLNLGSGESRQITFEGDPRVAVGVPVWSPDGKAIAFVSTRDNSPGNVGLWLVRPDGTDLHKVDAHGGWACWSHDSRWLQYDTLPELVLKRMPAEGGPAATVRSDSASRSALSPDGKTLYYVLELPALTGRLDYELRAASPPEGPSRLLAKIAAARVPSWQLFHPVISPDGLWLALPLTDGATTNIWAISTRDGSLRALTDFGQRPTFIARRVSWSSDGRSIYAALGEGDADVVLLAGLR